VTGRSFTGLVENLIMGDGGFQFQQKPFALRIIPGLFKIVTSGPPDGIHRLPERD
jgi:hypothetical protein